MKVRGRAGREMQAVRARIDGLLAPDEVKTVLKTMWTDDYKPEMVDGWVDKFTTLFTRSIFKWVQAPQAVHLGSLDLDRDRALQVPVVFSKEWL